MQVIPCLVLTPGESYVRIEVSLYKFRSDNIESLGYSFSSDLCLGLRHTLVKIAPSSLGLYWLPTRCHCEVIKSAHMCLIKTHFARLVSSFDDSLLLSLPIIALTDNKSQWNQLYYKRFNYDCHTIAKTTLVRKCKKCTCAGACMCVCVCVLSECFCVCVRALF